MTDNNLRDWNAANDANRRALGLSPSGNFVHISDLVGCSEIAARANVVPSAVSQWRKRDAGMPAPVVVLACGSLWLWSDIAAWLAARKGN